MPDTVALFINDQSFHVEAGITVAAAIAINIGLTTRIAVNGASRAPLCGMGVCQECRVTIDGRPHRLACQTVCEAGMQILTGGRA
ncbi:(2Fe-2S)-binding protein [Undibacterium sp.]|jgi:predicted molibdopterin-dependent oxidoreductase YjgC|uniref:(2Fe-2S)-binding protein n=1 Tax=Undibacterium sp. TaxID=1914977 RepID=UPI002CEF1CEF|nr:(2Fe-2S)-binding protein [Undibacterium sp.]HTD04239.1 (2Fe-2S)-binding protein [Undibacterium sp.]